jgi:hypothetical protein
MASLRVLSGLAQVLAFAVFVLACLKLRSVPAYLLGLYIVAYADIVLILQAAALMNAVDRSTVIVLQVLLTAASGMMWVRAGRPRLMAPFRRLHVGKLELHRDTTLKLISLGLVAGAIGYVYLLNAQLALAVLPNNYDSLTYHLSRVGYWLQYHSLYPWPTPNPRQTAFPMNAELGVLWTVLWWGTDRLAGFVQWTTVPVIMTGIYGLARLLGYDHWRGGMAALLWGTLTQVLFQSLTTQNDLVATCFWVAALFFFFSGLPERRGPFPYLSGLSIGLAMGTKSTSFFVLPGLGLAMISVLWIYRRRQEIRHYLTHWIFAGLTGFALFGSYIYIQNTIAFRGPFGPFALSTEPMDLTSEGGFVAGAHRLRDNLGRYSYQLVDFSPLPFHVASRINPSKAAVLGGLLSWLRIPVASPETIARSGFDLQYINPLEEDDSWFGPLAALLVPAILVQAYRGTRRGDALRPALAIIGIGFLVVESAAEGWSPAKGRYFMIPVALCFPLMAGFLGTRSVGRVALSCGLVIVGLVSMLTVTRINIGLRQPGWNAAFSAVRKDLGPANEFNYRMVMENVPASTSIGILGTRDFRDYPFFGEQFSRHVALAVPEDELIWPRTDMRRFETDFEQSDYLFLVGNQPPSIADLASGQFDLLSDDGTNSLWMRKNLRTPDECDGDRWPFTELLDITSSIVCPRFPVRPGLGSAAYPGAIVLHDGHFVPAIAAGPGGIFAFDLVAKETAAFKLSVQVVPRESNTREMLQVTINGAHSAPQEFSAAFTENSVLPFSVMLPRGTSHMLLSLAPGSTEASVVRINLTAP